MPAAVAHGLVLLLAVAVIVLFDGFERIPGHQLVPKQLFDGLLVGVVLGARVVVVRRFTITARGGFVLHVREEEASALLHLDGAVTRFHTLGLALLTGAGMARAKHGAEDQDRTQHLGQASYSETNKCAAMPADLAERLFFRWASTGEGLGPPSAYTGG